MVSTDMKYLVDFMRMTRELSRSPRGDHTIGAVTRLVWALTVLVALPSLLAVILMLLK